MSFHLIDLKQSRLRPPYKSPPVLLPALFFAASFVCHKSMWHMFASACRALDRAAESVRSNVLAPADAARLFRTRAKSEVTRRVVSYLTSRHIGDFGPP
jgi:hypothetical protein